MSAKKSRQNLTANVAQQFCGLLIAVALPIILGVNGYAQLTVVSVLIGLTPLADIGLSIVYTRTVPALYAGHHTNEIRAWNATILRFRFYASLAFGTIISIYYFARYQGGINSVALFTIVVVSSVTSFSIANVTVQSDFLWIRNITIAQSITRLLSIPFSWLSGLKGWFAAQLMAAGAILCSRRTRVLLFESIVDRDLVNWNLIRSNIAQGIVLSAVATLWVQLTSAARIYAALTYSDSVISQYGLVSSIYQIVVSFGVAGFVPQTIKIYRLIEQDRGAAIAYAFKLLNYAAPVFILMSFVLIYISPMVVDRLFPKYNVPKGLYAPLMLSLFNLSTMVTLGSLLIGMDKAKSYLGLIVFAIVAYLGFANLLSAGENPLLAAEAQLLAMSVFSIGLIFLVFVYARNLLRGAQAIWIACLPGLLAPALYFFVLR